MSAEAIGRMFLVAFGMSIVGLAIWLYVLFISADWAEEDEEDEEDLL